MLVWVPARNQVDRQLPATPAPEEMVSTSSLAIVGVGRCVRASQFVPLTSSNLVGGTVFIKLVLGSLLSMNDRSCGRGTYHPDVA
jgi:hypothetical protein